MLPSGRERSRTRRVPNVCNGLQSRRMSLPDASLNFTELGLRNSRLLSRFHNILERLGRLEGALLPEPGRRQSSIMEFL